MENIATIGTKLVASEYYINYYGSRIDIMNTRKVLALFINGSGHTGDMGQYYGSDTYELYMVDSESFGKHLIKIGAGQSYYNGNNCGCIFQINNGEVIRIDGLVIDNLFSKIFKR